MKLLHTGWDTDSLSGMSETMLRNIWIGIGIVVVILVVWGIAVMRRRRK